MITSCISHCICLKTRKSKVGPTDGRTDGRTETVTYRVAFTRLKTLKITVGALNTTLVIHCAIFDASHCPLVLLFFSADTHALYNLMASPRDSQTLILDVRPREEFDEFHLFGAVHVDWEQYYPKYDQGWLVRWSVGWEQCHLKYDLGLLKG